MSRSPLARVTMNARSSLLLPTSNGVVPSMRAGIVARAGRALLLPCSRLVILMSDQGQRAADRWNALTSVTQFRTVDFAGKGEVGVEFVILGPTRLIVDDQEVP